MAFPHNFLTIPLPEDALQHLGWVLKTASKLVWKGAKLYKLPPHKLLPHRDQVVAWKPVCRSWGASSKMFPWPIRLCFSQLAAITGSDSTLICQPKRLSCSTPAVASWSHVASSHPFPSSVPHHPSPTQVLIHTLWSILVCGEEPLNQLRMK